MPSQPPDPFPPPTPGQDGVGHELSPRKLAARELFAALPGWYDTAGAIMSFGQDARWRRAMVDAVGARPGQTVLDVATGTGLVARELVRRCRCTVTGVDQSPEMLAAAARRLRRDRALERHVTLLEAEAERLPFADASFDHLTFTYLLRYVDEPGATLRELARVVRPGGRIAALEFGVPPRALHRAMWSLYTRHGLPAVGRLFSREWSKTGAFLAQSIPELYERYPLEHQVELWRSAGIEAVHARSMSMGAGVVMWGTRRGRGDSAEPA